MNKRNYLKFLIFPLLIFTSFFSCKSTEKTQEEKFWKWFSENEKFIYDNVENPNEQEKLFDKIHSFLLGIDENLVFEFSPIKNGIREFSISADGISESFPAVEKLIEKSPNLKNWKFYAFRQRVSDISSIQLGNIKLDYKDIFFRYTTENNELGIELNIRNFDDSSEMKNAVYILLDNLIGEYDTTKNIDWIEWKKLNEKDTLNLSTFIKLREVVDLRKK